MFQKFSIWMAGHLCLWNVLLELVQVLILQSVRIKYYCTLKSLVFLMFGLFRNCSGILMLLSLIFNVSCQITRLGCLIVYTRVLCLIQNNFIFSACITSSDNLRRQWAFVVCDQFSIFFSSPCIQLLLKILKYFIKSTHNSSYLKIIKSNFMIFQSVSIISYCDPCFIESLKSPPK